MNYYYITKLHLIVSDEEIKIDDNYLALETNYSSGEKWIKYVKVTRLNGINQHKIIAGIYELPSINYSNLTRTEKVHLETYDQTKLIPIDIEMERYPEIREDSFYPKIKSNQITITKIL